eukprot:TRINITY_DN434_c0_g1_i2.p1 TRINITY_DN434_c0_g1~~TRINITY_DN434_c0_g1_i2.p1  ORF type:complete len:331 (-),score=136.71 TRINITY_DN434_c0_g1_i2:210-1100(-)
MYKNGSTSAMMMNYAYGVKRSKHSTKSGGGLGLPTNTPPKIRKIALVPEVLNSSSDDKNNIPKTKSKAKTNMKKKMKKKSTSTSTKVRKSGRRRKCDGANAANADLFIEAEGKNMNSGGDECNDTGNNNDTGNDNDEDCTFIGVTYNPQQLQQQQQQLQQQLQQQHLHLQQRAVSTPFMTTAANISNKEFSFNSSDASNPIIPFSFGQPFATRQQTRQNTACYNTMRGILATNPLRANLDVDNNDHLCDELEKGLNALNRVDVYDEVDDNSLEVARSCIQEQIALATKFGINIDKR